jgi:hypothetical protein
MHNFSNLIGKEDKQITLILFPLLLLSIVIGSLIHIYKVRMVIGSLCVLVLPFVGGTNLTTVIMSLKPLIDLTWDVVYFTVFGINVNSLRIIAVLMFFVWGYFLFTRLKQRDAQNLLLLKLFSIYLFFSIAITTLIQGNTKFLLNNFIDLLKIFDGFLLYAIAASLFSDAQKRLRIISVIWLSNLFVMVINTVIYFLGNYKIDVSQGIERFNSLYNDPGCPALVALVGLIFSILYVNLEKRKLPMILLGAYIFTHILALWTLYITITRVVIMAFAILYVIWYGYHKRKLWFVIPILLYTVHFLYTTQEPIHRRFETEVNYFFMRDSKIGVTQLGGGRVFSWSELIDIFNNDYNFYEKIFGRRSYGAHNEYMAFLMQFGIIGLTFYILLILLFFKSVFYFYNKIPKGDYLNRTLGILSIVILFIWVTSAISGSFIIYTTFLWSLFTILALFLNSPKPYPSVTRWKPLKIVW